MVEEVAPRTSVLGAAATVVSLVQQDEGSAEVAMRSVLANRRQMNRQLTVQESRHKLARDVCHGKRGTIHQAYRDGMEDLLTELLR